MLGAEVALAHVELLSPPPRLPGQANGNQLKSKPCGQTTNKRTTDKITTFAPGQKVDLKIREYVNHPGYFAVAFDPDGDDSFPFPRENMDKIVAASDDPKAMFPLSDTVLGIRTDKDKDCYTENAEHECTISITIPNVTCANCTLQVTQFMYDKLGDDNDNEYYYQCADIKIEGAGSGGSGSGGAASAGAGTGGSAAGSSSGGGGTGNGSETAGASGTTSSAGTTANTGGNVAVTAGTSSATAGTTATPTAGTTTTSGTAGSGPATPPNGAAAEDQSGCGMAKGAKGGQGHASTLAALGLALAFARRRRAS